MLTNACDGAPFDDMRRASMRTMGLGTLVCLWAAIALMKLLLCIERHGSGCSRQQ
jgi:hypothetical protein